MNLCCLADIFIWINQHLRLTMMGLRNECQYMLWFCIAMCIILLNNIDVGTDISILFTYVLIYTMLALCVSHVHWFFVPTLMLQMK